MEEHFSRPMPRGICTCGSLRAASRRVSQYYDSVLAPLRLKITQFSILAEVHRGGLQVPISMHDLAVAMFMDRSTLGHNLRPLVRDELLHLRTKASQYSSKLGDSGSVPRSELREYLVKNQRRHFARPC